LARHAVACFLTRGDLWQSWEAGAKVFDLYLLDADWALNNANWQWLSCSNFFYQYFRCYSPVAFGKKTDPTGKYIRKWLPKLANIPDKYIFEPWLAPKSVQEAANCIIGTDYPSPIVVHEVISKQNIQRMKCAYDGVSYDSKSTSAVADVADNEAGAEKRKRGKESKASKAGDITSYFDKKKKK
jgi:cryptochrome